MYRSFGVSVIGMTNIPEAKLAREAEICYGVIALATDYDCWHESQDDVSIDAILAESCGKNVKVGSQSYGSSRIHARCEKMPLALMLSVMQLSPTGRSFPTRRNGILDVIAGRYIA
jgi:5'-methylthioadenosine phosphorylase